MLVVALPVSVHHRGGLRGWRVVRNRPGGASPSGGGGGGRSGSQVEAREVFAKVLRRQVNLVQHLYSLLAGCWEKRVRSDLKEINCTPLRLEHSLTESPLALPLSEKSDLRWSRLSAEPERLLSAVLRRMCGVGVEPPLLPAAGVLDDSSPKKSGKSVPCRGMTPSVLSIMWSDAAPVVLSSSRVERSLK